MLFSAFIMTFKIKLFTKIMRMLINNSILMAFISFSFLECVPLPPLPPSASTPTSSIAFPPPSTQWHHKSLLLYPDLERSYATLSRRAVGIDVPFEQIRRLDRNVAILPNSRVDLSFPNDVYIRNQPIGTFQYTDSNGELHIVNYFHDFNGLKILNDYKPYAKFSSAPEKKSINKSSQQNDENNKSREISRTSFTISDNKDNEKVDWDEVEYTFVPGVNSINVSKINSQLSPKEINNNNNLNKKAEPISAPKQISQNTGKSFTELLLIVKDSIPLPKPFTPINPSDPPFFLQRPTQTDQNWRGPPIPQSILYGIPLKDSAPDLGPQPFPHYYDWNYRKQ